MSSCFPTPSTPISTWFGSGEGGSTKSTSSTKWPQRKVLWSFTISCSAIRFTLPPTNLWTMFKNRLSIRWGDWGIIPALCYGLEITRSCRGYSPGAGDNRSTEKTTISCLEKSYLIYSKWKVVTSPTSSPPLPEESEMQGSSKAEIYTIGEYGQRDLLSKATKLPSEDSTPNLAPSPCQCGKQSSILHSLTTATTTPRRCYFMRSTTVDLQPSNPIWTAMPKNL